MSIVVSSRSTKGLGKGGRLRTIRKRAARGQQAKQCTQTDPVDSDPPTCDPQTRRNGKRQAVHSRASPGNSVRLDTEPLQSAVS